MPVTVYKSTDAGAPVLNGLAGSLCTVLDAVLVNGYGAKAAAGWAIEFTGTNKRIYRPPSGLLRGRMRVQDDAPRAAPFNDAREARIRCSEGASSIDVQTVSYPSTTNGLILRKSLTADAEARPWIAIADARTIYMFVKSGDYGSGYAAFGAGEFFSVKGTPDNFNGIAIGSVTEQLVATPVPDGINENLSKLSAVSILTAGHFVPRSFTEFASAAQAVGKHGNAAHSAVDLTGLLPYPNPVDNALYLSQVWVHEDVGSQGVIRGRLRGFWHFLHDEITLSDQDTWSGVGPLAGKTFIVLKPTPSGAGVFVMETSDTWETN